MRVFLLATTAALAVTPVFAADTPVAVPTVEPQPVHYGEMRGSHDPWEGFYVKGQAGYIWPEFRGATYAVTGGTSGFSAGDVDNSWYVGAGVGFQVNRYLRTELMLDYTFDSDFTGATVGLCGAGGGGLVACTSTDTTSWDAYTLMASAYVDLDFWEHHSAWGHIVPFVGGGIGGSYVNWDRLNNTACQVADPTICETIYHEGESSWRFAWQVEAGASYYFRCDFAGEASYRYRRIGEGAMFGYASSTGPGTDNGINVQSVNLGLRYYPGRDCEPPYVPPHVPPVYK